MTYMRYKDLYNKSIQGKIKDELGLLNIHSVPKLLKIVINMGLGSAVRDSKIIKSAMSELSLISGQFPIVTKARKSEATFKLREGVEIGCKVTLRRSRMYDFLERLVKIALPRVSGFVGVSPKSFDGRGNLTIGIKDHIVFPEINFDNVEIIKGMDITFVTSAKTDSDARLLLSKFEIPFIENNYNRG